MEMSRLSGLNVRIASLWSHLEFRVLMVTALVVVTLGSRSPGKVFTEGFWEGIFRMASDLGFLCIGESLLLAAGEVDLSIASVYAWAAYIVLTLANGGSPFPIALITALVFSASVGLVNGIVRLKTSVHPVIVTLASAWGLRGVLLTLFGEKFSKYQGEKSIFIDAVTGKVAFFPSVFLWFIGLAILFTILLNRTKFGNHVLAVGGDVTVARNMGVPVERVKILSYIICSLMAGFAGCAHVVGAALVMPTLGTDIGYGFGKEFEAICVSVMAGTSIFGGIASMIAVLIASIAYSTFRSGLILMGLPGYWYIPVSGLLLIIFVIIHQIRR